MIQKEEPLIFLTLLRDGAWKHDHKVSSENCIYMLFYGVDP